MHKKCKVCEKSEGVVKFRKWRRTCNTCTNQIQRLWRHSNPDKAFVSNKKQNLKRYGITLDEYKALLAKQKGKCAICGNGQSSVFVSLDVDHCHRTGKVRGLLCANCNSGLGRFQDKVTLLKAAINYIRKHR